MAETLYDVLNVAPDADEATLRRAFRRAARRHSPDLSTAPDAHEQMVRVNEAGEELLNPERRAAYDLRMGLRHPRHTVRIEPAVTDLGTIVRGDGRTVEIAVYVDGESPLDVEVPRESGDGWHVADAELPHDGAEHFLLVRVRVEATAASSLGRHEEHLDLTLDDDTVQATFVWAVVAPAATPSATRPTMPPPSAGPRVTPSPPVAATPALQANLYYASQPTASPSSVRTDGERAVLQFLGVAVVSFIAWAATPLIAGIAVISLPALATAVWAPGEDVRGHSGPPAALYQHLGLVLVIFNLALIVAGARIGPSVRVFWPIACGIATGLVLFLVSVISLGGALWQWDILPATTFAGFVGAQLLTIRRDAHAAATSPDYWKQRV